MFALSIIISENIMPTLCIGNHIYPNTMDNKTEKNLKVPIHSKNCIVSFFSLTRNYLEAISQRKSLKMKIL